MRALASYEASVDEVGVSDPFLLQSSLVWLHQGIWRMSRPFMCVVSSISVGRRPVLLDTSYEVRLRVC
jgi:hypothetical protein